MHDSHLVAYLIARVEAEVEPTRERVSQLSFLVGALATTSPGSLKTGIEDRTAADWGYVPAVVVVQSPDIDSPGALGVSLVSIQVGG